MKKRILSLLLTLVMILGMIPATTLTASAASDTTVSSGGAMNLTFDYNGYKLSWNQLQSGSTIELKITAPNASGVIEDVVGSDQELKYPEGNSVDLVSKLTKLVGDDYCYANPYYGKGTYTFTVMETKDGYLLNEDTLVISNFAPLVLGFDARMSLIGVNGYDVDYEFVIEEDYSEGSFSIPAIVHGYSGSYTVSKVSGPDHIIVDSDGTIHGSNGGTVKVKIVSGNHTVYRTFKVQEKAVSDKALNKLVMVGFGDLTYNQLGGNKKVTTFRGGTSSPTAGAVVGAEGFYDGVAFIYDAIGNVEDRASISSIFGGNETLFNVKVYNLDAYDSSNKEASYDAGMVDSSTAIKVGRYAYIYHSTNPGYNDYDISDYKIVDYYTGETLASETIDFATFSEYFISPTYYVYDVKPEIHSVSVNGTSVADGASYNSNSKNVTIKTTYDSTLSAAMLEYGCTSVKALSQWYVNGVKVNKAAVSPVDNGNGTETKTLTHTLNSGDVLEIRNWLEVTWPDGTTDIVDEHTMTVTGPISEVNVGATWSGTPANATSNTDGITVTGTQWYRQNGSTWTALTSSDTIKEGYTYRCEVTVAATDGYTLADGYTVKINGTAATKKSGNTWYRDVTITGISDYVDVDEIGVPEAYTNPVFTYDTSDVAPSRKHWDVVQVEWVECDKDGKVLSDALTENDVFKKDTYYRVEVTVVPETNWQFHGSDLGFYINGKAANYLYGYNKAYADSVTGYLVYNTADIEGTYTLYVYDNSLTGSAKDILIEDGQYLGSDATAPTTTQPASGGYAYYKNGVLLLNNYNNEDAHFVFEEGMLDLYLKGDNTIGAICDHSYLNVSSALDGYRDGSLTIDGEETASLFVAGDALDAYCSIFVENELYINGGDITVTLGENSGDAVYAGGGVTVADDYTVYVNSTGNDFAAAHKWDGSVSLDKYHTVWFKDLKHQFTTQPTGGIVATGDTHTVSWKTNFTPEQIIVEAWKSSGGSYKASREYYSGTTTSVELPALSSGGHYYIIAVYDDGSVTSDVVYVTEVQAITDVTLSVVDPVAGKNPSFTVTLPQDAPYEHAVNEAFWIDRTDSSKALTETDTFVAGHEYIVTVRLKAKDGYRFLKDESDITVNVGNTQDFIKRLVINENEYLEVVFVLTATDGSQSSGVNVSGTVTSFNSNTDTVTIQLIEEGHTEVAYEVTTTGNSATYSITDVVAGTYTMKVSKNNHVTREYTVTVGSTAVTQDAKIHLLGDINGDGKVTTIDFVRANSHAKGVTLLTGYELMCADTVKQDGLVTTVDAIRINAHARGTSTLW